MNAGLAACELSGPPKWKTKYKALPGIAFRNPVMSRLSICKGTRAEDCLDPSRVLATNDAAAPQLGRLVILPFENGFGANNKLSAEFRPDGSLESMDYGTPEGASSPGRNVATSTNSIMDEALKFEQARLAKKQADKEAEAAAATTALDAQIATLKKQQELLQLQTAMDPANLAAKAELDALNAQIARLTAQKTIKELEGSLN